MNHYLAILGCHWPNASRDIIYLICHVTSENHVIKGSNNVMSGNFSWCVTILSSLVVIGIVLVEI